MKYGKKDLLLYAVTGRGRLHGDTLYHQVEQALEGGATFVQLREKELDEESLLAEARELKSLCRRYRVPFVVNDHVEIAMMVDADGVHVGQSDQSATAARKLLGPDKIIGVSAQTVEQALEAERMGADYLGVGAVFPTGSKADADDVSRKMLMEICGAVHIPVVAIGGIGKDNVRMLTDTGISGIAVISALFSQPDIVSAARELRALAEETVRG